MGDTRGVKLGFSTDEPLEGFLFGKALRSAGFLYLERSPGSVTAPSRPAGNLRSALVVACSLSPPDDQD